MKLVILAGGLGTRISEESHLRPKPMIEVGGKPILWHIMKIYSSHGVNDFVICCGYKGYQIKEYFLNYAAHMSDVTIDLKNDNITVSNRKAEPWKVTLVDTGENTMTGGRLKRVASYLQEDEVFCMTYGDGVSDVDIGQLLSYHAAHGKLATLTAVTHPARFGVVDLGSDDEILSFREKSVRDSELINGGFFVLSRKVLDYIDNDETIWERRPLECLAAEGQLKAYKHLGFWQPMDTLRDKNFLNELWASNNAPWKTW